MAYISNDTEAVQPPGISWWDCHGLQTQYSDDDVSWDGCFLQTIHLKRGPQPASCLCIGPAVTTRHNILMTLYSGTDAAYRQYI